MLNSMNLLRYAQNVSATLGLKEEGRHRKCNT